MNRCRAFSLLEVVAAVAILALATAMAGWSVRRATATAGPAQAVDRLIAYDQRARAYARRFRQPVELTYRRTRLSARAVETEHRPRPERWASLRLPEGFAVGRLQPGALDGRVRLSVNGHSPSYAVVLRTPGGERRWIFFAGATGEAHVVDNPTQAERLLELVGATRLEAARRDGPDAD